MESIHPPQPLPHSRRMKILSTIGVLIGNITFGCALNMFAPVVEVLRIKYDTTVDQISLVFTIILIAYCIGALSSGFIYYIINKQLGTIICFGGIAIGLYFVPFCGTKYVFFCLGGALGFFFGGYDTAQVVWIIEIWQGESGPYLQAQQFFYALGCNIPPLILGPFLSKSSTNGTDFGNKSETEDFTTVLPPKDSELLIPFSIAATLNALACFYQIFLFTFCRYYTPPLETKAATRKTQRSTAARSSLSEEYLDDTTTITAVDTINNQDSFSETDNIIIHSSKESLIDSSTNAETITSNGGINWSNLVLIILSALFLGAYQGMEVSCMQFIPTFAKHSELKLSDSDAAFVLTGVMSAYAVGRGSGILIIMKVPPLIMLCGNLILVTLGNIVLLFWASSNLAMLWTACILLGAGFSTIYASFLGYMEKYLVFTNAVGSFTLVTGSIFSAIYPLVIGGVIEINPVIITYTNFVSIAVCTVTLGVLYKLTYQTFNKTNVD